MGGLLAFRVGNYDNTAEREQFRFLCQQLKSHYENSGDFCIFVGNYNIGCELDALFIKKDAIIAIEFKNYGGNVVATENGEWTADGVVIKGGSRKTVLQQARINHTTVKRELKALGVEGKQIKDVPHLVVFHQPIDLENRLSATNKSWLHITDDEHFLEKLDDITCPKTDLDPLGIVNLAELLNLNSFYLSEYSNANYEKPVSSPDQLPIFEDIKSGKGNPNSILEKEVFTNDSPETDNIHDITETEIDSVDIKSLKSFVQQILSSVLSISDAIISVWDGASSRPKLSQYGITINKKLLVKIESKGIGAFCSKLSRFINHDVRAITPNLICWQEGDAIDEKKQVDATPFVESELPVESNKSSVKFHKSKTILPHWLDIALFSNLGAIYSPEYKKFEYNLDIDIEDVKIYLGTYFPRSYAEAFCIFDDLFKCRSYIDELNGESVINILDYGCGTGGELIGLIVALSKHIPSSKTINVIAVDGNHDALTALNKILEILDSNVRHKVSVTLLEQTFKCENDIPLTGIPKCHFILNSKIVCELISRKVTNRNGYYVVANMLANMLADKGILYMLDVTTKDEHSGLFYPQLMNQCLNEFISKNKKLVTLLPLACDNWKECRDACFMQQTFNISHSRKSNDESRVCYRLICNQSIKQLFIPDESLSKGCSHIIHPLKYRQGDSTSLCSKSIVGGKEIDSYNIKL